MSYNRKAWEKRNKPHRPKKSQRDEQDKPIRLDRQSIKQQLRKAA